MSDEQTPPIGLGATERPRFKDQVRGMRAVVAVSLATLVVGGLGGRALGRSTGDEGGRFGGPFGGPGGGLVQRGVPPRPDYPAAS